MRTTACLLAMYGGAALAASSPWPPIDPVPPPVCTLAPTLALQPAFPGPPEQLPTLSSLPGLAAMRDCFAATVRAQAHAVYAPNAALGDTHRMEVGAIHFLAHEGNIASTPASALLAYADLLDELGVEIVGLHLGAWPWLCEDDGAPGCSAASVNLAKYDALFARLAQRGLRIRALLPIAPSQRLPTQGWEAYRQQMANLVSRVLARHPGRVEQVGMHEPSSVEALILRTVDPEAVLDPALWRQQLLDPVCALAHADGALCSASLIPGPPGNAHAEWRFLDDAILSSADRLGVNNIQFYGLEESVVAATADFVQHFASGTLAGGSQGPARGLGAVFFNASWRAAWPMADGRPLESNAAGLGCVELDPVDVSYLGALFAWARALRVDALHVFYTTSFIARTSCDRDLRVFASVHSSLQPGVTWPWYQIGNPISDGNYRQAVLQALAAASPATSLGRRFAVLASIARTGSDLYADGFEP